MYNEVDLSLLGSDKEYQVAVEQAAYTGAKNQN